MITGAVKDLEARIRLKIRGPQGSEREIEAVIDTLIEDVDTEPLIGMALLEGYDLHAEISDGGKVEIHRLPRP